MPIKTFDRTNLKQVNVALAAALKSVENDFGIKIALGNGRFTPTDYKIKLEAKVVPTSADGKPISVAQLERQEFNKNAPIIGLKPEDYGVTFFVQGTPYTIVGVKPRNYVAPIIGVSRRGTRYKFKLAAFQAGRQSKPTKDADEYFNKPLAVIGKRNEDTILADFRKIEAQLSPENLTADGERPKSQVRLLEASLNKQKNTLIAELGREPSFQELYGK